MEGPRLSDGRLVEDLFGAFNIPHIEVLTRPYQISCSGKRSAIMTRISQLDERSQISLVASLDGQRPTKRRRLGVESSLFTVSPQPANDGPTSGPSSSQSRFRYAVQPLSVPSPSFTVQSQPPISDPLVLFPSITVLPQPPVSDAPPPSFANTATPIFAVNPAGIHSTASTPNIASSVSDLADNDFMKPCSDNVAEDCLSRFIDRTSNDALRKHSCLVCARHRFAKFMILTQLSDIPHHDRLRPGVAHPSHDLHNGLLLCNEGLEEDGKGYICKDCKRYLSRDKTPPLALSNRMWIGAVPHVLSVLTLPERILVCRYFPVAHIIKLYPAGKNAFSWSNPASLNRGLRGNVSTYQLDVQKISDMVVGDLVMPPPVRVLAATIGITFIGPDKLPERTLPDYFIVRRRSVLDALLFLKSNNPLYALVEISEARLQQLPECAVPEEIYATTKFSSDTDSLARERAGYVPENSEDLEAGDPDDAAMDAQDQREDSTSFRGNTQVGDAITSSDIISLPLQPLGVVDVEGDDIPDADILAHALSNVVSERRRDYLIPRGSAFVNEYARVSEVTGERFDGGPGNPNHLLGCFPVLFPYGQGGFEVERTEKVAYEEHARWALEYFDGRFRRDLQFIFQVFGVMQKRQICRSACLQIKRSAFISHQTSFRNLDPSDFLQASKEETRHVPFSNVAIQGIRRHITAVRARVSGTNEARLRLRSKIWSTNLLFNPPSLWITINPSDTNDPIAQVLAGCDIDLDHFVNTLGPNATSRSERIAADPFAAAEFFQVILGAVIEELFGIKADRKIQRREGILGHVNAFVAAFEAQGRGTLHVHMMLWLGGAPSASQMQQALLSSSFREKVQAFIKATISADFRGATGPAIEEMHVESALSYSRPPDPRASDFGETSHVQELKLARSTQIHSCHTNKCLLVRDGRLQCKRGAPFVTSPSEWITETGEWGPKRIWGKVNAWNRTIMLATRANHDIKIITNGPDTNNITWYITGYTGKKQGSSFNTSALLADRLAFHKVEEKRNTDARDINRKLIQRCANALTRHQEFSAPEVVNYIMGWGDHLLSHHYVPVYWDRVMNAVKAAYPGLRSRRYAPSLESTMTLGGMEPNPDTETVGAILYQFGHVPTKFTRLQANETAFMTLVDGVLTLQDQLKEYADRGLALSTMNMWDFFRHTYDTSIKSTDNETSTIITASSNRIPYLPNTGRQNHCRVVRAEGHEMLLQFVGPWFPRNDDPAVRELYCASALVLIKPWRSLGDLKASTETFDTSLASSLITASSAVNTLLQNIQYFHECSDGAHRRHSMPASVRVHYGVADMSDDLGLDDAQDMEEDEASSLPLFPELTEQDVIKARAALTEGNEGLFGDVAMGIAKEVGIFEPSFGTTSTAYLAGARCAAASEVSLFHSWNEKLKAVSRAGPVLPDNSIPLPLPVLAAPYEAPAESRTVDLVPLRCSTPVVETEAVTSPVPSLQYLAILNVAQRRAHDIIERHLLAFLGGRNPPQLLMQVLGQGGTGKTVLLNAITKTFLRHRSSHLLAKTATSGVAASLIGGQTLHSWGSIPIYNRAVSTSAAGLKKRQRTMGQTEYLTTDECSMIFKEMLAMTSEITTDVRVSMEIGTDKLFFGGLNVILFGDYHQHAPVENAKGALYVPDCGSDRGRLGLEIFQRFVTVVILTEQNRVRDLVWKNLLDRLRVGECTQEDLAEVDSLVLDNGIPNTPDFSCPPWSDAVLVTSRHGVRNQWNTAAIEKHCCATGNIRYTSSAEDFIGHGARPPTLPERVTIAGMKAQKTGKLAESVDLAVGMRAMVILNIATEADLANGTRGVITDIILDSRETTRAAVGFQSLSYPPACVIFKPDHPTVESFPGLEQGLIPIVPCQCTFTIEVAGKRTQVTRRQMAITPAYAFTDHKAQGQTLEYVIIDIARPPSGTYNGFNVYVALSRSRGRDTIRLLRQFDNALFTVHPSEALRDEDNRLAALAIITEHKFNHGGYDY